jgi:RNA recognition motif-containing protein
MLGVSNQIGLMSNGLGTGDRIGSGYYDTGMGYMPALPKEEGLIDTAIVIKNIPFNVRKEALMDIMMENQLPIPYAFNYHFDQGVFRGLAFANFQTAQDTRLVIERMNGLDVHGRKLRVEYKKQLPEHERERIEREKREKRGQLEEQHRPMIHGGGALHTQSSAHSLSQASMGGNRPNTNGPLCKL